MVNNLVFRWPKPLFFMVLWAHGTCSNMGTYDMTRKSKDQTPCPMLGFPNPCFMDHPKSHPLCLVLDSQEMCII